MQTPEALQPRLEPIELDSDAERYTANIMESEEELPSESPSPLQHVVVAEAEAIQAEPTGNTDDELASAINEDRPHNSILLLRGQIQRNVQLRVDKARAQSGRDLRPPMSRRSKTRVESVLMKGERKTWMHLHGRHGPTPKLPDDVNDIVGQLFDGKESGAHVLSGDFEVLEKKELEQLLLKQIQAQGRPPTTAFPTRTKSLKTLSSQSVSTILLKVRRSKIMADVIAGGSRLMRWAKLVYDEPRMLQELHALDKVAPLQPVEVELASPLIPSPPEKRGDLAAVARQRAAGSPSRLAGGSSRMSSAGGCSPLEDESVLDLDAFPFLTELSYRAAMLASKSGSSMLTTRPSQPTFEASTISRPNLSAAVSPLPGLSQLSSGASLMSSTLLPTASIPLPGFPTASRQASVRNDACDRSTSLVSLPQVDEHDLEAECSELDLAPATVGKPNHQPQAWLPSAMSRHQREVLPERAPTESKKARQRERHERAMRDQDLEEPVPILYREPLPKMPASATADKLNGGRLAAEPSGGLLAAEPSGGRLAAEPSGGRLAAEPSGGRLAAEPSGGRLAAEPSGGRLAAEPSGGRMAAEQSGGRSAAEPTSRGRRAAEPNGERLAAEQSVGRFAADPSGGGLATERPDEDLEGLEPDSGGRQVTASKAHAVCAPLELTQEAGGSAKLEQGQEAVANAQLVRAPVAGGSAQLVRASEAGACAQLQQALEASASDNEVCSMSPSTQVGQDALGLPRSALPSVLAPEPGSCLLAVFEIDGAAGELDILTCLAAAHKGAASAAAVQHATRRYRTASDPSPLSCMLRQPVEPPASHSKAVFKASSFQPAQQYVSNTVPHSAREAKTKPLLVVKSIKSSVQKLPKSTATTLSVTVLVEQQQQQLRSSVWAMEFMPAPPKLPPLCRRHGFR